MSIIFFDIDGTVMDLDGTIPPSAVTAVRRLRQAGHHCVINTGRPRLAMDPQLMDMDFDGLVCSCGQYIQLDGKIIRHVGFDRETSRKILEIGRRCRVDMYFEEAERIWCDTPHGVVNRELRGAIARLEDRGVRVGQPDGDPDFHFDKVCVLTAPDSLREEFLAEAAPMCQVIDRGNMLELPVRGYSKASGCLAVAQALGEDLADCYAIGDSANDLEMLQCPGPGAGGGGVCHRHPGGGRPVPRHGPRGPAGGITALFPIARYISKPPGGGWTALFPGSLSKIFLTGCLQHFRTLRSEMPMIANERHP